MREKNGHKADAYWNNKRANVTFSAADGTALCWHSAAGQVRDLSGNAHLPGDDRIVPTLSSERPTRPCKQLGNCKSQVRSRQTHCRGRIQWLPQGKSRSVYCRLDQIKLQRHTPFANVRALPRSGFANSTILFFLNSSRSSYVPRTPFGAGN